MYNISFSWKNEKVLYRELFSSYIHFSQFFGLYKMYGCPILNTHNVSDSKCINLFIKIIVIFIKWTEKKILGIKVKNRSAEQFDILT